MTEIASSVALPPYSPPKSTSWGVGLWRRAPIALTVFLALVAMAVFAPWLSPYDPNAGSLLARLREPGTSGHWLGTDQLGRDMLSRLIWGARRSLVLGLTPVAAAVAIGGLLGVMAGFLGGKFNTIVMRGIDVLFAFPATLLALAISGALGPGWANLIIALTMVFIAPIARVAESESARLRNADFVCAARLSGASSWFIARHHLVRCVLPPLLIYAAGLTSVSMIYASGLSFLGLGTKPPDAEWGLMLNSLRDVLLIQPLLATLPGVLIFAASMSLNRLGDALRDVLDVNASR